MFTGTSPGVHRARAARPAAAAWLRRACP